MGGSLEIRPSLPYPRGRARQAPGARREDAHHNGAREKVRTRRTAMEFQEVALGSAEDVATPEWASISPVPGARGAQAVDEPEVAEVLDKETGEFVSHRELIGDDYERAVKLRMQMQTDKVRENARYCCAMCFVPVYLVMHPASRNFFLKHTLEDGRCSAVTRGQLSQKEIDAIRYNGIKESRLHIEMKRWIAASLRADSRFSDVAVEERWSGKITGEWRKPDVRATFNGVPVVFEVQLSTTYIGVIAERREFYLREGALLVWVFASFPDGERRLTQDDVFFNNNRNAFIVNQHTRDESFSSGDFKLLCVWFDPIPGAGLTKLKRKVVSFADLTLDVPKQRVFFYDFDGEHERQMCEAWRAKPAPLQPLRDQFERWYMRYVTDPKALWRGWDDVMDAFADAGFQLPEYPSQLPEPLLKILYSTKHGRVVGWDFTNFIQVAHRVMPGSPRYLNYFRAALKTYKRGALVKEQDTSGKWMQKVKAYRQLMAEEPSTFAPDTQYQWLIQVLFPEIFKWEGALSL